MWTQARSERRWLWLYAFALSGGLGLAAGWGLDWALRHLARRGRVVPQARLWWLAGIWAALWVGISGGSWVWAFYRAALAFWVFGGRPPGYLWSLCAGWGFWTLAVAAGLPNYRRWLQPPWLRPAEPVPAPPDGPAVESPDGVELGRDARGRPVMVWDREANQMALVAGATGSGKSNTLLRIAGSAVRRGPGLVFIDPKGSPQVRQALEQACRAAGRDLRVWSPAGPCVYNPLAHGDPTELRDKVMKMHKWSEVHYEMAAERYLGTVTRTLAAAAQGADLARVAELLNPGALRTLARHLPDERGRNRVNDYLDRMGADARSAVDGLANRLATLVESTAGRWLGSPQGPGDAAGDQAGAGAAAGVGPDAAETKVVDLLAAAHGEYVVLFSLDAMRYPGMAAQMGALILQDLQTVAAHLLAEGGARRAAAGGEGRAVAGGARLPFYVIIDEFSALDGPQVLALLNKAREAGFCCILATQDLADVAAAGGDALVDQVLANTNVKVLLRQDSDRSASRLSAAIGGRSRWAPSYLVRAGEATRDATVREIWEPIVEPDDLKHLPPHQAYLVRKAPEFSVVRLHLRRAGEESWGGGAAAARGGTVGMAGVGGRDGAEAVGGGLSGRDGDGTREGAAAVGAGAATAAADGAGGAHVHEGRDEGASVPEGGDGVATVKEVPRKGEPAGG
jgi:conjugal transfer pilus assembly protein TraD